MKTAWKGSEKAERVSFFSGHRVNGNQTGRQGCSPYRKRGVCYDHDEYKRKCATN